MDIKATGYVPFIAVQTVEENDDKEMNVALVKSGTGSGSFVIRSAIDNSPLSGIVLNLRRGWNCVLRTVLILLDRAM